MLLPSLHPFLPPSTSEWGACHLKGNEGKALEAYFPWQEKKSAGRVLPLQMASPGLIPGTTRSNPQVKSQE